MKFVELVPEMQAKRLHLFLPILQSWASCLSKPLRGNASFSSVNKPGLIFAKWPVAFARSFSTWGVGQTWRLLFQTGAHSSLFPSVPVRSLQSCLLTALGTAHLWVLRSLGTGIERCIPSPRSYLWKMGAFVHSHRFIPTHLNFLLRKKCFVSLKL